MPDRATVHRWVENDKAFRTRYVSARELQADNLADECIEIADAAAQGSCEEIQAARLRFDARRWLVGKLAPKRYSDRLEIQGRLTYEQLLAGPDRDA
jgi:hypothetical protein